MDFSGLLPALRTLLQFNWLDYIFLVIIVYNIVLSVRRGFITQVIGLLGLIAAIYGAGHFDANGVTLLQKIGYGGPAVPHGFGGPQLRQVTAFVIIFFVILIAARILAIILSRTARVMMLGWADHLGGAVFGLVESITLVLVIVYVILHFFAVPHSPAQGLVDAVRGSRIVHTVGPQPLATLTHLVPIDMRQLGPLKVGSVTL